MRARAEEAEKELRAAQRSLRDIRSDGLRARKLRTSQGARDIMDDIRSGRGADIDDVFEITKPWLMNISPVINRIRAKEEKDHFDTLAGEYGRKYDLNDRQQRALRDWLDRRAEENAEAFVQILTDSQSTVVDLMMAGRDAERNLEGIDAFMEGELRGQALADFKQDRLMERIESVEGEANNRLHRLDNLVDLDPAQEDQLFFIMARGSEDYLPTMDIEGMTGSRLPMEPVARNAAIREALRPDQLERFEAHRRERRGKAEQEMRELGLRLPDDWDLFEEDW